MLDYSKFPPVKLLLSLLKSCPETVLLYINLWHEKDSHNQLTIDKMDTRNHFHVSPTIFRNHCLNLQDEEILTFDENDKYFFVYMQ